MNSIEITRYLYKKGYITKDAALRILKTRKELVKEGDPIWWRYSSCRCSPATSETQNH